MKRIALIIFAVVAVAWLGWRLASPGDRSALAVSAVQPVLPATTQTNPAEVFRRAFWKRPAAEDKIVHAERREWKDAGGVTKWEWCIEVQPSPALVKHLRDDNAFGLLAGGNAAWKSPADWFPKSADGFTVMQSVSGSMTLLISHSEGRLYATDSGGGFRPGAPAIAKPVPAQTASNSRLPASPPPRP